MEKHTVYRHMIEKYKNGIKIEPKQENRNEFVEGAYNTLDEAWKDMKRKAIEAKGAHRNTRLEINDEYKEIELKKITSEGVLDNGNKIVWKIINHPVPVKEN